MDEATLNQFYDLMRRFRKVVYSVKKPEMLLLDLDSTLLNTYGHQEGEGFNFAGITLWSVTMGLPVIC